MPVINQIELNPTVSDRKTVEYCKKNNILISTSSPLARRPPVLLGHSYVNELANKYNKTPSQVILNWGIVQDFIVCPKSTNP
jgi:aldehyde reductase/L-glyceraldehyde reductase